MVSGASEEPALPERRRGWGPRRHRDEGLPEEPANIDLEEFQDASIQGDRSFSAGTIRAALSHPEYRIFSSGMFASMIGTWMQSVALGALAYDLTRDARFVAGLEFVRLVPMLLLSLVGGALADIYDRRRILVLTQAAMLAVSVALAVAGGLDELRPAMLLGLVALLGIANALGHPAQATMVPHLVGRRDLGGAVALQSTQMNLSRVIGPAIGGIILPIVTISGVFVLNAATYVLFIVVIYLVPRPPMPIHHEGAERRVLGGFLAARQDPLVGRILLTMTALSLLALPFVGLLPVLAAENLGLDLTGDPTYGFLYAAFGVGVAAGALSVGTWLAGRPRHAAIRASMAGWAVLLALFGLNRSVPLAFPLAVGVGFVYFVTVISLNTMIQEQVDDAVRGRVMALWIMAWGGTVPFGLMIGGQIAAATSMTVVTLYGAAVLAVLAIVTNLDPARLGHPASPRTTPGTAPAH